MDRSGNGFWVCIPIMQDERKAEQGGRVYSEDTKYFSNSWARQMTSLAVDALEITIDIVKFKFCVLSRLVLAQAGTWVQWWLRLRWEPFWIIPLAAEGYGHAGDRNLETVGWRAQGLKHHSRFCPSFLWQFGCSFQEIAKNGQGNNSISQMLVMVLLKSLKLF